MASGHEQSFRYNIARASGPFLFSISYEIVSALVHSPLWTPLKLSCQ